MKYEPINLKEKVLNYEERLIVKALSVSNSIQQAANLLMLNRTTLVNKLRIFKITADEFLLNPNNQLRKKY